MNSDAKLPDSFAAASAAPDNTELRLFIEENAAVLLGILRSYVANANLVHETEVSDAAQELLAEVITEAFKSKRFNQKEPIRPWLLGIASNLIRRRRRKLYRKNRRELPISDTSPEAKSDAELFERIASRIMARKIRPDSEFEWVKTYVEAVLQQEVEDNDAVEKLLALVGPADSEVLRLAYIHDLDGEAIARALGINNPSTARSRLHRAVRRLRKALEEKGFYKGETKGNE